MYAEHLVGSVEGVLGNPTVDLLSLVDARDGLSPTDKHLSGLVVEENDSEEGEGWDGEMWERNHAGSKRLVDEWQVAEEGNEGGLEEESEVGSLVDHTLLGDGEVSGLANEEIGPLDAHNGDKISSLSVEESLKGVANEVLGDVGVDEELWNIVTWSPSALGPV